MLAGDGEAPRRALPKRRRPACRPGAIPPGPDGARHPAVGVRARATQPRPCPEAPRREPVAVEPVATVVAQDDLAIKQPTTTPYWIIAAVVLLLAIVLVGIAGGRSLGYFGGAHYVKIPYLVGQTATVGEVTADQGRTARQGTTRSRTTIRRRPASLSARTPMIR